MTSRNDDTCTGCQCDICVKVQYFIKQIFQVLDIYGWLLDSYIVDFFIEDSWNKLPGEWQRSLDDVSPEEFGKWILREQPCQRVWPLSLIALRQVIQRLEINRNHNLGEVIKCSKKQNNGKRSSNFPMNLNSVNSNLFVNEHKFNNLFLKHVKTKKRYEIEKLAQILGYCASETNCTCIVDIGAGMGHLARVLAFKYGLSLTCIEQDPLLITQAKKYDKELLTSLKKSDPDRDGKIQHISMTISATDSGEQIVNYLTINTQNETASASKMEGFGLVGLHPCGDLASTLLRFYSSCEEAKLICIVGCCYMKLTLGDDDTKLKGYPMSRFVSSIVNNKLSFNALEVACHAVEKHCDKLKNGKYADLVVHTYRAALEYVLLQKSSELRHMKVKSVKVKDGMSFVQYCKTAMENLEPEKQPQFSELTEPKIQEFLNKWKRVLAFCSLRLMLAPLVETCVLLDRFLFLSEKGLVPSLSAEFDCRVSPRNFVLISTK